MEQVLLVVRYIQTTLWHTSVLKKLKLKRKKIQNSLEKFSSFFFITSTKANFANVFKTLMRFYKTIKNNDINPSKKSPSPQQLERDKVKILIFYLSFILDEKWVKQISCCLLNSKCLHRALYRRIFISYCLILAHLYFWLYEMWI